MLYLDVYEEVGIWAIKVHLRNKTGYTLWATREERDEVLTVGHQFVLFKTPQIMTQFMTGEVPTNFSDLPGYVSLSQFYNKINFDSQTFEYDEDYNFNKVTNLLAEGKWEKWTIKTCAKVLNAFNLIWDIATSLKESSILDNQESTTPTGKFLDFLTFVESSEINQLQKFDHKVITETYNQSLDRIENKTILCL